MAHKKTRHFERLFHLDGTVHRWPRSDSLVASSYVNRFVFLRNVFHSTETATSRVPVVTIASMAAMWVAWDNINTSLNALHPRGGHLLTTGGAYLHSAVCHQEARGGRCLPRLGWGTGAKDVDLIFIFDLWVANANVRHTSCRPERNESGRRKWTILWCGLVTSRASTRSQNFVVLKEPLILPIDFIYYISDETLKKHT